MSGTADVLRQKMAENPIPKEVYTAPGPISPATTPTSAQVDSLPFSETTSRPTLPATSFYSHNDSSQQDTTQSTNQPLRQTLSPSPTPLTRPYTPQNIAYSTSSSSNPSPSDSMMLSGTKPPPTIDKLQEILEDFFSSDSNSSDSEENLETVLSSVLHDPLENCMEGIEDLATSILRTGKLSVQGEAGDMSKLQPILFGLQATEKETAQLLPQLMQVPFFEQVDTDDRFWGWSPYGEVLSPEDFLAYGHIRLGLPIDTAIYHLLNRHCAKGARQAEEVIQTSQTIEYVKTLGNNHVPALICSASVLSSPSPPLTERFAIKRFMFEHFDTNKDEEVQLSRGLNKRQISGDSGVMCVESTTAEGDLNSFKSLQVPRFNTRHSQLGRDISNSSLQSNESRSDYHLSQKSTSSSSLPFSPLSSTSSLPMVHSRSVDMGGVRNGTQQAAPLPALNAHRRRKTSQIYRPSVTSISGSEISDDGTSSVSGRLIFDRNVWNTTIMDNNMIVAMFGDTTYPLLIWNPKLKMDFEISSSMGLSGMTVAVDQNNPILNIRLHNPTPHRVAFSIRAYRQTCVHNSHIIYPVHGLHVLEQAQCWEENADIHQDSSDNNEYVVVELFFAALEASKPSWNVLRKYAVMKARKKRQSHGRPSSHFQMPGMAEKKRGNLKQVIAHGLQCVVKNKHSEAEIIFTQALFLPDFQRIELKAFVYICLAVVAYRRQKAGEIDSLTHAMNLVNSVDKLVDACEAPRTIRMPRTVHLVKQLRKELNFSDIVKTIRKKDRHKPRQLVSHYHSEGSSTLMCEEGGYLSHKHTALLVPRGSLDSQAEITLSSPDHKQLQTMLASTGWEKMVRILCAVHIESNPSVGRFQQAVEIRTTFPEHMQSSQSTSFPPLLLHSNYLRKWEDITKEVSSTISISEGVVDVTTDRIGWLGVAIVDVNPIHIASMAMQALSISPMTLQVCIFGQRFPDDIMQITVLLSPSKEGEEQPDSHPTDYKATIDHDQISFPHLIQAYPGEQIRCRLKGSFEPDANSSETNLDFHFKATQAHNCLSGKFIHFTKPLTKCHGGKMVISRQVSSTGRWEDIADVSIHISNTSGKSRSANLQT